MTKKERIIEMFNSKDWNRGTKVFYSKDFKEFELSSVNDAQYAQRVIKELSFSVSVGMGLFVEKSDTITTKDLKAIDHAKQL